MKFKVLIRSNGVTDSFDAQLAYRGSAWLLKKLLTPAQIAPLNLRVAMRQSSTLKGCLGRQRTYLDNPNKFQVAVARNQGAYMQLRTLCHEFVHLHQCVRGDLTYQRIDGVVHSFWKGVDHTDTAYEKCPWEIEANEQEKELAREFLLVYPVWRSVMGVRRET